MKQVFLSVFALLLLVSCQKEEGGATTGEASLASFKSDWVTSKLDASLQKADANTVCYLFSKEELNQLLANEQLGKVRFVLGLTDGKLDMKTVGVTNDGTYLGIVNSLMISDESFNNQIVALSSSTIEFESDDEIIDAHILNPKTAFAYIKNWNVKLAENQDVSNVVSYDNLRINHFSIEKEVIDKVSDLPDFKFLGVVFGVNPQGKLTTVLFGLDSERNIILPANEFNNREDYSPSIFDFTKPCPSTCD
ncbi:hypothetical protein ABGT15_02660 [Flavobacterium enshiense]|uniref:hypothetical protein n=1 Tax=Flavobacterium enshiense TaxID=1341165 RepID=UPI00345DE1C8